jgi:hypothetical protein
LLICGSRSAALGLYNPVIAMLGLKKQQKVSEWLLLGYHLFVQIEEKKKIVKKRW